MAASDANMIVAAGELSPPGAAPDQAGPVEFALQSPAASHSIGPERYVAATTWPPFLALGMTALNVAAMFAVSVAPLAIAGALGNVHFDGKFLARLADPGVSAMILGGSIAAQLLATALLVWSTQWRGGNAVKTLALRAPIGGVRSYLWAVPAFVLFGAVSGAFVQWLSPKANLADTEVMLRLAHSPAWWLMALVAIVGAPLYEELAFRGFLFSALARTPLGLIGTAIVTSFLWALIHGYSVAGISTIFALGIALSAILWRTGSTRVTMACHGAYNAMAFAAAFLTPPTV
jgi:uncharacterized protein